jgi:hypothetical protein
LTGPYRRFSVRLYQHTGAVILWHPRTSTFTGTLEQCEKAYRDAQTHNLLAGWCSVVSLLMMNWIALFSKQRDTAGARPGRAGPGAARREPLRPRQPEQSHRCTPAPRPAAGVVPDPSGPGQRYWDGVPWTHWTHPR